MSIDVGTWDDSSLYPNDPRFDDQWYLFNTGQAGGIAKSDVSAPEAWATINNANDVVVAVIDSGVDIFHDDLYENIWQNTDEITGTNIDDDGNGQTMMMCLRMTTI